MCIAVVSRSIGPTDAVQTLNCMGGSPGAVVEAGYLLGKSAIAGSNPTLTFKFKRNKIFLPRSLVMIQYCEDPPLPKGSVLGLKPPGLEFRIMCLEGSVILFISPSSDDSHGPV